MPSLLLATRDVASVQNTFSSWDSCMSQSYCKWPVIAGIIVGSLIVLSVLFCCARCLCCGVECCCACCSCFNRCCPSPRGNKSNQGYQQPPAQPYGYGGQYQSPAPPMYGAGQWRGYRGAPQTATFDAPGKKQNYNEDSLPAMPSWNTATSRHELVQEEEDVEMRKMDQTQPQYNNAAQSQPFLAGTAQPYHEQNSTERYYNARDEADIGNMQSNPYQDYDNHQQFATSPVATPGPQTNYAQTGYQQANYNPPNYQSYSSPQSTVYEPNYAPSVPPSYHTAAPPISPPPMSPPSGLVPGRKPVQGTYRDV